MKSRTDFYKITRTAGCVLIPLAVFLLLAGLVKLCNYLVVDDADTYTRLTMHEFYEREGQVETLFLGSSHCYRAYDVGLYEELTGETAFNLGSSAQNLDTSYYLLKEAADCQPLKKVYLDVHFGFLMTDPKAHDLVQAYIMCDYMRPSLNKLDFILHMSTPEHYTNNLFPFRRNWQRLGDLDFLRENLEKKSAASYREYAPVTNGEEFYAGSGFVSSSLCFQPEEITWWEKFDKIDMSRDMSFGRMYLGKMAELCQERGIELVFVTAPSYEEYLDVVGPYEPAHDAVRAFAEEFGVDYLDFNLKGEDLGLTSGDFIDVDHLNQNGAEKVTRYLAGVFR